MLQLRCQTVHQRMAIDDDRKSRILLHHITVIVGIAATLFRVFFVGKHLVAFGTVRWKYLNVEIS